MAGADKFRLSSDMVLASSDGFMLRLWSSSISAASTLNFRPVFSSSSLRRGEAEASTTGFVMPVI